MQDFYKYHGAGNDFVIIDARSEAFDCPKERVAALCNRRTGIGADGLMILENHAQAEFLMRYFNADGGEATMCGNGGRCMALFAHHLGIGSTDKLFMGVDGAHAAKILCDDGVEGRVRLQMIDVDKVEVNQTYTFLNTGSPHYVEFCDNVREVDVYNRGKQIRHSDTFAAISGTNVNFVEYVKDGHIKVRTFERGVEDETLACGTGSVASALASALKYAPEVNSWRVDVEGGELAVEFEKLENGGYVNIFLEGPAIRVFKGEFDAQKF
ncbi:MAG: diaminopimelate epimerase [Rikenellaceae bacterium]